jgi:O-antigen ligase
VTLRLPWENVPLIAPKAGDLMVHCSGILAFWVAYLGGRVGLRWTMVLTACVVLVGTFDRAGLLTFSMVFALCLFLRPFNRCLWRVITIGICGIMLFAASNIHVPMPNRDREISFAQLLANLTSTVSSSASGDLDGTKQWRLDWWRDILNYTVHGKYCWDGKGFGINLADDDGYQVEEDASLRDPHNGHLTMLARAGLPGLLLWALVQGSWACSLLGGYLRSQQAGDERWAGVFLFVGAYWLAFMINTAFDVFLEGPMGGIWFWTVYGVGLAALWIYKHNPEVLDWLACADGPAPAVHPADGQTMLECPPVRAA